MPHRDSRVCNVLVGLRRYIDRKIAMKLTYSPPQVFIEPSFWEELYSRKIDEFKLDDSYKAISAEVSLLDGWTNFSKESFNLPSDIRNQFTSSSLKNGTLFNFNTMNVSVNIIAIVFTHG